MDRDTAWQLLCEYTESDSLRKHGLAVEAIMRRFAEQAGEDVDAWGVVGLVHDFDYERFPDDHPASGEPILREAGMDEQSIKAVLAHGDHLGIARETAMAKTLFAVDELAGFITAVALVRPSKSLLDVKTSSVRKKLKDRGFARAVNREDITKGAGELDMPVETLIEEAIAAMQGVAEQLGLAGSPTQVG